MKLLLVVATIIFISCNGKKDSPQDELRDLEIKIKAAQMTDSLVKKVQEDVYFDTAGLYAAPVKVTKARIIQEEYSNYKSISLTYKNVSGKRIEAIRFRWKGTNAFGEPADMGTSLIDGYGGGFDDDPLGVGKSRSGTWSILSRDARKVVLAWPYEVAFSDGTKWQIK